MLVTKILQTLSNGIEFSGKEPFMKPIDGTVSHSDLKQYCGHERFSRIYWRNVACISRIRHKILRRAFGP